MRIAASPCAIATGVLLAIGTMPASARPRDDKPPRIEHPAGPKAYTTLDAGFVEADGLRHSGAGVQIHLWDRGAVRGSHLELAGAVRWADDTRPAFDDHATQVAAMLVALGIESSPGTSFGATVSAYDWDDDAAEMKAAGKGGALLSNHAYGWIRGWHWDQRTREWYWYGDPSVSETEDVLFGFYDDSAQARDQVAFDAPMYLICNPAGSDRGQSHDGAHWVWSSARWVRSKAARDPDGGASGYDSLGQLASAKNILTVGSLAEGPGGRGRPVASQGEASWGPTDDGRVKPDIVAKTSGAFRSPAADHDFGYRDGESSGKAGPNVTGALAQLVGLYRDTHGGADMRAATLKGLIIHTASEAGDYPGPDYRSGWGALDTAGAAAHIERDAATGTISEAGLESGQTLRFVLDSDGTVPFKATACWTDPPGTPPQLALDSPDLMLVNDLDVRVLDPQGAIHEPWVLDPLDPDAAAMRGDNFRDNVEVVALDAPARGLYVVEVSHKGDLVGGRQDFSLLVTSPPLEACPPGELRDCDGNCVPESWLDDGVCDGGPDAQGHGANFLCAARDFDTDDCVAPPEPAPAPEPEPAPEPAPDPEPEPAPEPAPELEPDPTYPFILWRRASDGRNSIWYMDGAVQRPESGLLPEISNMAWEVAGTGDFDGDGDDDVMWWESVNGRTRMWLMDGTSLDLTEVFTTVVSNTGTQVVATGDFDGDGRDDILWHNAGSGRNWVWFMDGAMPRETGLLPDTTSTLWKVAGTGDFDGDGDDDILWWQSGNSGTRIWFMEGTSLFPVEVFTTQLNNTNWRIAGTGDFDSDGRADILWRHVVTGDTWAWFMDGATVRPESGLLPPSGTPLWKVAGTCDFDRDGFADILWRHDTSGRNRIWFMNGTSLLPEEIFLITVTDVTWDIVGTGN